MIHVSRGMLHPKQSYCGVLINKCLSTVPLVQQEEALERWRPWREKKKKDWKTLHEHHDQEPYFISLFTLFSISRQKYRVWKGKGTSMCKTVYPAEEFQKWNLWFQSLWRRKVWAQKEQPVKSFTPAVVCLLPNNLVKHSRTQRISE